MYNFSSDIVDTDRNLDNTPKVVIFSQNWKRVPDALLTCAR